MLNVHLSISLVIYIYFSLFSVRKTLVILYKMYFILIFLDVCNGLIEFTLFLMENIASIFVPFSFRQTFSVVIRLFWLSSNFLNGLITKTEVPL